MSVRALVARINRRAVGELREENGIWTFVYDPAWVEAPDGYALSPALPRQREPLVDDSTRRSVQWYFDNLLPEEGQRTLLAKDARISAADAFGLLAYYGAESAGSLTLLPPETPAPETGNLRPLPDEELQRRISNLPRVPLLHNAAKRMSLAGAQHKLPVVLDHGALFEPAGATPSTHILKPDRPDADYPHSVINEWFVMRLAGRLKLRVPEVWRRYVPAPIYLIERFDRHRGQHGWSRVHNIDACQLLDLDRSFKYAQGSVERLSDLAGKCRTKPLARVRLFTWLVFNVLTGNSDTHLKNLSFSVGPEGIELAPHYDLLSIAAYDTPAFDKNGWPGTEFAWPILAIKHFADINRNLLIEAGKALKLSKDTCDRILDAQGGRIEATAAAL